MRVHEKTYVNLELDIRIASTVRLKYCTILKPNIAKVCYRKVRLNPNLPPNEIYEITQIKKGFIVNEPGLQVINSVAK